MTEKRDKLSLSLYAIFTFIALVILVDFVWLGRTFNDEIINVQKERQQYYNAARNYHYSYKVNTNEHEFFVTEDFAKSDLINEKIEYSVSPLFKEVNWYRFLTSENKSYYSLRIISGLVIPILTIVLIFLTFRYKLNIGTLVFITEVILIVNLIYLLT